MIVLARQDASFCLSLLYLFNDEDVTRITNDQLVYGFNHARVLVYRKISAPTRINETYSASTNKYGSRASALHKEKSQEAIM